MSWRQRKFPHKFQLPTEDWPDFESDVKVSRDECLRSEFGVRFHYFSMADPANAVENVGSDLVRRRTKDEAR